MRPCDLSATKAHRHLERSSRRFGFKAGAGLYALIPLLLVVAGPICGRSQSAAPSSAAPITPDEIIRRMLEQNKLRADHLKYFSSLRHYRVEFHGLGRSMTADMHVQATYTAGKGKSFQVIDQSGSHVLIDHVLMKLLETERDDSRQHESGLVPANYDFSFQASTVKDGRKLYIFAVEPKTKQKLLYQGKISVDADDYAVVSVDAQPAKSPSFWIKSTEIHHAYSKFGEFWLPEQNRSESKIRLGGTAVLTIDYGNYQLENPHDSSPGTNRAASSP